MRSCCIRSSVARRPAVLLTAVPAVFVALLLGVACFAMGVLTSAPADAATAAVWQSVETPPTSPTLPPSAGVPTGVQPTVVTPPEVQDSPAVEQAKGGKITASRVAGLLVDGLRFGLLLALAAVGLSLIFGTTGLTNFAHGELVTLGAVVALYLNVSLGMRLIPAAALTVVICGVFGGLLDTGFWRVLRRRGTGLLAMMIVSIGLALLGRYLILFFVGGNTRTYAQYVSQEPYDLGPITLAPRDLVSMGLCIAVLLSVGLALLYTRIGKATRAVADNPSLAASSGIDVERVILYVWVAGAAMAGLAGVLLGVNQQINWQMGFQILLLVFAGVTLGGLGTAFGALVGSLIIGVFLQLSTLVIPAELKNVGALGVLILILLVRPQGILGRAERIG